MALKAGGFFKKALNVIGLVDEPDNSRGYDREYDRGYDREYDRGYGRDYGGGYVSRSSSRPSTYVPPQQRSRTAETRRRTVVPDQRSRYGGESRPRSRNYDFDEGYTVRRTGRAYEDEDLNRERPASRGESRRAPESPATRPGAVTRRATPTPPAGAMTRAGGVGGARTVMFTLKSLAECSDVVDTLIANDIVLLMLNQLDDVTAQRVVDTMSGAAFALHATIRKASDRTYLIAPRNVEVNDPNYFGRGV